MEKKKNNAGRPRQNPGSLVRDCQITFGMPTKEARDAVVALSASKGFSTVSAYLRALVQREVADASTQNDTPRADSKRAG